MRRNRCEIYLHFVWTTIDRLPLVTPEIERSVYRCIDSEAQRLGCDVLAVGGMPDHIHLAVKFPTTLSASKLMQQVKAVSSYLVRDQLTPGELFRWREGYGVFSLTRSHCRTVIGYINNQKRRHAAGQLWPSMEEPDENAEID